MAVLDWYSILNSALITMRKEHLEDPENNAFDVQTLRSIILRNSAKNQLRRTKQVSGTVIEEGTGMHAIGGSDDTTDRF